MLLSKPLKNSKHNKHLSLRMFEETRKMGSLPQFLKSLNEKIEVGVYIF